MEVTKKTLLTKLHYVAKLSKHKNEAKTQYVIWIQGFLYCDCGPCEVMCSCVNIDYHIKLQQQNKTYVNSKCVG